MSTSIADGHAARLIAIVAAVLLALAIAEAAIQVFGISLISRYYSPGRMMELSATLMVFVVALLLRQIRDAVRARP